MKTDGPWITGILAVLADDSGVGQTVVAHFSDVLPGCLVFIEQWFFTGIGTGAAKCAFTLGKIQLGKPAIPWFQNLLWTGTDAIATAGAACHKVVFVNDPGQTNLLMARCLDITAQKAPSGNVHIQDNIWEIQMKNP